VKGSVLNIDTIGFSSSHFAFRRCLDSKFDTYVQAPICNSPAIPATRLALDVSTAN